ncbi:hypothetical protein GW17_00051311 [Ensete ventricosum]|nr:hypothetical protein GW17_00051311 [Ensete ventricosum]
MIILFSKGCPSPSTTLTTPLSSPLPLRRRRLPCLSEAAPTVGSAPAGGNSTGAAPLRTGRGRALPLLAVGGCPCRWRFCPQASPLTGTAGLPCGHYRLAMGGWPYMATGRGWPPLLVVFTSKM